MQSREPSLSSQTPEHDYLLQLEHINDSAVFYPGRQHGKHLDLLLHLSRYSNLLLTVTGPSGSGKTHLKNRMVQQLDSGVRSAQLDGGKVSKGSQLLTTLAHHFKLEIPPKADAALYISELRNFAGLLNEEGGSCLILIDRAEQLEADALNIVLELATTANDSKRPHIALFGREALFDELHNKTNQTRFESVGHHLPLEAFTEVEARGYLEHRCHSVGLEHLPLDDKQFHRVYKAAMGWPGLLNKALIDELQQVASQQPRVEKKPASPAPAKKKKRAKTPLWPLFAGAVVIAGLVVGFLYQDRFLPQSPTPDLSIISRSQEVRREAWQPLPPISDPADAEVIEHEEDTATDTVTQALEEPVVAAEATTPPVEVAEPSVARQDEASQPGPSETPDATPLTVTPPSTALDLPDDAPATAPQTSAPVAPAPVASSTTSPWQDQGFRREAYLMSRPSGHFTLQMMGSLDESSVRSFIQAQSDRSQFSYFEGRYQGRPWYVVVYGDYANREQALAAIQNLPEALRNQRPWARSFQSVQNDIRSR